MTDDAPMAVARLNNWELIKLEVTAEAQGWDHVVAMCRDERQRRAD